MNNIALGQYLPMNSIVHRMDPRAKIAAMLIVMIAIFIPAGYSGYAVLGIVVCAVAVLARLRLSFVWRAMPCFPSAAFACTAVRFHRHCTSSSVWR